MPNEWVIHDYTQHFPGYSATTEDISLTGMRVTTTEPMEITHDVLVSVELDDQEVEPFQVYADVAWTGVKHDGAYHSGLRFLGMEHETKLTIRQYISTRLKIEKKLHTLEETDPLI